MSASGAQRFDVLTMGWVGVDVYPLEVGVSLRDVATFGKFLGGSPTNVAVASARLGRRAAVITRTGDDLFGLFVHDSRIGGFCNPARALVAFGVACADAMPSAGEVERPLAVGAGG